MNSMVETLNGAADVFVKYSLGMLIQSSALILVLLLINFMIRKKVRAVVRYFLWMLVLVKLMLPTTFALPTGLGYWMDGGFVNPEITQIQPQEKLKAALINANSHLPATESQVVQTHAQLERQAYNAPASRLPGRGMRTYPGARLQYQLAEPSSFQASGQPAEQQPIAAAKTPAPVIHVVNTDISWQAMVLLGYLAIAAAMALLLAQRIMFVRSLIRQSTSADDDLQILLSECRHTRGLNIKRKVDIRLSASSASPAICGLFKPVILIPEFLPDKLDRQQLKAVLLHELIHLKRGDLWVNMIQTILQIVNFYNPLLWVANAVIRRIREQAVDETVLVTMGNESKDYPQTLINVAGLALSRPALSLRLVGVVESKSELAVRIKHMMAAPLPKSAKLGLAGAAMLITFAALLLPMAGAAQKPAKEKPKIKIAQKSGSNSDSSDFDTAVIFINNIKYGSDNGLLAPFGKTGTATCGHPGAVSKVTWKWLKNTPQGSEYEITRIFPFGELNPTTHKKIIKYNGYKLLVWKDDIQKIEIRRGETKISGTIKTADNKAIPKDLDILTRTQIQNYGRNSSTISSFRSKGDKFETKVESGKLWICTDSKEYAPSILGPYIAKPLKKIDNINLVLKPGYEGKIQFVNKQGETVPVEKITAQTLLGNNADFPVINRFKKSDNASLWYIKHTLDTPYLINAIAPGYEPAQKEITFEPGKTVIWQLRKALPTTGKLIAQDGKPVVNATINICTDWLTFTKSSIRKITTTDQQGRFEINCLDRNKSYNLLVITPSGNRDVLKNVRAGQSGLKFELKPETILEGTITGNIDLLKIKNGQKVIIYTPCLRLGTTSYLQREKYIPVKFIDGVGHFEAKDLLATYITIEAGDKKIKHTMKDGVNEINIKLPEAPEDNCKAAVEDFFAHNGRDITSRKTVKWGQPEKLANGNTKIRYTFEAIIWEKDKKLIVMDFVISPDNKVIDAKKIETKDLGKVTPPKRPVATQQDVEKLVELFFKRNYKDIKTHKSVNLSEVQRDRNGNVSIIYTYLATFQNGKEQLKKQIFTFDKNGQFVEVENIEDIKAQNLADHQKKLEQLKKQLNECITAEHMSELHPKVIELRKEIKKYQTSIDAQKNLNGEYYVMGDVQRPGVYAVGGKKITTKMAIAAAGLNDLDNIPSLVIIRRNSDGTETRIKLDAPAIFKGEKPDIIIQNDDILMLKKVPSNTAHTKKIETNDIGKVTVTQDSKTKQVLAVIEAFKADVVKLSKDYPQLTETKDIPITQNGWTFRHDYRDMGKMGYENTGSFPVGIGLQIMSEAEFNKKVHSQQMQIPSYRWKGLNMVGWVELHTGDKIPSELTSSLQKILHDALAKIGKLNRQKFDARLPENIKQQRTAILTKASIVICNGIHKLAEQFPQLKKAPHWNHLKVPKGQIDHIGIHLRRNDFGKTATDSQISENQRFSILVIVKPQPDQIEQLVMSELYPNLGLVGQVNTNAGNPKLNEALKKLVADALAPLDKLNAQAADINKKSNSVAAQNSKPTPKVGSIVIDPALPWRSSGWAGNINTDAATLETRDNKSIFAVATANRRHVWTYYIANRFSPQEYPIAVLTYRAKNTSKSGSYVLWLDDTSGPNSGGIVVFKSNQLIADGKLHELRQDMRKLKPVGDIIGMALGVRCGSEIPAEFELIGLKFEPENPADKSATQAKLENDKPIKIQVVDENGQPIDAAKVVVDIEQKHLARRAKTDSNGMATVVPVKNKTGKHMLYISAPGKISVTVGRPTQKEPIIFPPKITLPTAVNYSGVVQDKNGRPIEGVAVSVLSTGNRQKNVRHNNSRNGAITDADGKWQTPLMPKCKQPWIKLAHPDYISNNYYSSTAPVKKMLDGTAVFTMEKGLVLTGSVAGPNGKPVQGAHVKQGRDRWGSHFPDTRTDSQGKFAFKQTQPGEEIILTVQKGGFAPAMKRIHFGANTKPICIQLKKGNTIRGKIVDKTGKPVPGARITADTWQGCRAIDWGKTVGKDGKFVWNDAPADSVEFDIYRRGYMSNRQFSMSPSDTEYTVTLLKPIKVTGSVVDSETGKAIPYFKIINGIRWDDKRPVYWQRRGSRVDTGKNGKYEVTFDEPRYGHHIRIEAEDYEPAESRMIKDGEGNVVIDFKLKKGTPIKGIVYQPDGKKANNAQLNFVLPGNTAYIRNGNNFERQGNPEYTTKNDGQYNFGVQTGKWMIAAIHPTGYAELSNNDYKKGHDIKLKPWGKIKGRLMIGRKPGANEKINIFMEDNMRERENPRAYHQLNTTTDKNGYYEFDRVPPCKFGIGRYVKTGSRSWSNQQNQKGEIKAGQTLTINIGGKGRPVKGKITLPESAKDRVHWQYCSSHINTKRPTMPKPDLPDNWDDMSQEQKSKWYKAWQQSDAGKSYKAKMQQMLEKQKYFNFGIKPDGSFYVEDVPAGTYQLCINAYEPPKGGCGYGDCIGLIDHEFTIPPMAGGRMDEPFDTGSHELLLRQRVKIGSPAPSFEVKTLEGKTIKLSDFKGKYVLLDFWATWCGPCRGETPHIKAVYDKYGKDSRFAIIGLSLDNKMEDAKKYVEKKSLKWTQGFLGEWSKTKLPNKYGVNGIPAIFLIGPNGKVIAKNLRGNAIIKEVSKYLGQKNKADAAPTSRPAADKVNALEDVTPFVKKLAAQDVKPLVWILHNNDADFRTPPFEDTLVLLGNSKKPGLKLSGFNICESCGAHRMLTHSKFDDTVIICDNVKGKILKYDNKGNLIFGKKCKATATDVLSDGSIFALTSDGIIYGKEMLKLSPKGKLLERKKIGGFDLAADEKNKSIYVVGDSIKYVGFDMVQKWKIDPIEWCAVSVDICSDGSAWVAERKHPDLPASKNCIMHVSPKGKILQKIDLDYSPLCLRVDKKNNNVYVVGDELYKYDSKGKKIFNVWIDLNRGYSIDIDRDGNIWVGTREDVKQFSPKGKLLGTVKEFSNKHQKYIACCK